MVLENWRRIPRALFAKAWVVTGHVTKERILQISKITEQEWNECSLYDDPAEFREHLGLDAAQEPSLEELIEYGAGKRRRVVWQVSSKGSSIPSAQLPASLVFPVEKRVANYLFAKASDASVSVKTKSTVIISRKLSKEISAELSKKYTIQCDDGTRELKECTPNRTKRDHKYCLF